VVFGESFLVQRAADVVGGTPGAEGGVKAE
jgi:hypothetical protein